MADWVGGGGDEGGDEELPYPLTLATGPAAHPQIVDVFPDAGAA